MIIWPHNIENDSEIHLNPLKIRFKRAVQRMFQGYYDYYLTKYCQSHMFWHTLCHVGYVLWITRKVHLTLFGFQINTRWRSQVHVTKRRAMHSGIIDIESFNWCRFFWKRTYLWRCDRLSSPDEYDSTLVCRRPSSLASRRLKIRYYTVIIPIDVGVKWSEIGLKIKDFIVRSRKWSKKLD